MALRPTEPYNARSVPSSLPGEVRGFFAQEFQSLQRAMKPASDVIANTIDVRLEGASGNGRDDDSTFFQRALNRLVSGSTMLISNGQYLLNAGVSRDLTGLHNITIRCEGEIQLGNAVANGFDLTGGENINIQLRFSGGGASFASGAAALKIKGIQFGEVDIYGKNINGTLLNVAGNFQDGTACQFMHFPRVHANTCGRAFVVGDDIIGKLGQAFGTFGHIWDYQCVNGSIFRRTNDIFVSTYDSFATLTGTIGLDIDTCGGFHAGLVGCGGQSTTALVRIKDSGGTTSIKKLYMLSETVGVINGLVLATSPDIHIGELRATNCNKAIETDVGSSLDIGRVYMSGNTTDLRENGVNKTLGTVGSYTAGNFYITGSHTFRNGYRQEFLTTTGKKCYLLVQADDYLTLYGTQSDGTQYTLFKSLVNGAGKNALSLDTHVTETVLALSTGTATPNVGGGNIFTVAASATAVTDFGGDNGQTLTLVFSGNRTITHGATIKLNGAVNFGGTADDSLTLVRVSGVWYEKSRAVV